MPEVLQYSLGCEKSCNIFFKMWVKQNVYLDVQKCKKLLNYKNLEYMKVT